MNENQKMSPLYALGLLALYAAGAGTLVLHGPLALLNDGPTVLNVLVTGVLVVALGGVIDALASQKARKKSGRMSR